MVKIKYLLSIFLFLSFISLSFANYTPIINDTSLFYYDLNSDINIYVLLFLIVVSLVIAYFGYYALSSLLLVIIGVMMLFNGFNLLISILIIIGGVIVAFKEK